MRYTALITQSQLQSLATRNSLNVHTIWLDKYKPGLNEMYIGMYASIDADKLDKYVEQFCATPSKFQLTGDTTTEEASSLDLTYGDIDSMSYPGPDADIKVSLNRAVS